VVNAAGRLGRCHYLSLHEASGYSVAAKRCILALRQAGVSITWVPFVRSPEWGLGYAPAAPGPVGDVELDPLLGESTRADTVVAHLVPEYFPIVRQQYPDAFLVGHTVWETNRLPPHWVALLEMPDVLVIPCRWNAAVIGAAGVGTPVVVVPHAAGAAPIASSNTWARIPSDAFVFYTIAPWTARKALWNTVRAYLTAFTRSDAVLLVVKTSALDFTHLGPVGTGRAGAGTSVSAMATLMGAFRDAAAILVVTGEVSDTDIAALHSRGDCFVSLCRSEGWGLGAFDAATYGNPVVITGFGGHLDYLDSSYAYLVDYNLVPVDDPTGGSSYLPEQTWAEPSVAHGASLLRRVFEDPGDAARRASELAHRIRGRYDPSEIARQFIHGVASRCPPPRRIE
jgi:glycosyltransferase involved in cell wall biosynthesis